MNSLASIFEDLRGRVVARLETARLSVPAEARTDVRGAVVAYLRVLHRSITPRARRVHRSAELRARELVIDPRMYGALGAVLDEIVAGADINQRLTRRHFKAGFNDRLLNDLGVCHLHLGPRDGGRDITRTHVMSGGLDQLLWAVVRNEDVYCLELLPHAAFESFDFARVLYDNWRFLLGPPLEGCSVDDDDALSVPMRSQLRRVGLFSGIAIRGELFMPGGFVKDGTSFDVVRPANGSLNRVTDIYRALEANEEAAVAGIRTPRVRPGALQLKVASLGGFLSGKIALVDHDRGVAFRFDESDALRRVPVRPSP